MQFRVLGTVDAVSAEGQVRLGHARQRCVLAVLLIDANRVVSVDQLIERVWGEDPPQRGRETLYSYLSRLRTVFSTETDATIERRSGGYLLAVDETLVDLHQFRELISGARVANEDTAALALFDQALRLWRGTPFADLDAPWLASVRAALELEHEAAQLDRTDTALRCGQHAQLLADLGARSAQQPFDERIAGQLMLALAGTGRQAEALSTYQGTRRALLDQLGLEPGPELRRLHERVLSGDADLVTPAPTEPRWPAAGSDAVVPRQLPAATRHFTGRHAELNTVVAVLESTHAAGGTVVISAIDGMAGIGKSALAVHAAHRLADQFPDGVLFTDLHGFTPDVEPTPPELALDHLLRGLGVPGPQIPPDLEGRAGLYRSLLARRRVLIVLDNAADETQLQPLLPATADCRAIVTSRRHLAGLDDAIHLTLPVLDPDEAASLFRDLAGDRATPADQDTIDRIVALCGRLPLAIRVTAARLRLAPAGSAATLCAELEGALRTGQGLEWLTDGHRAIGAALAVSYRHLPTDQQHALHIAGLHPGPSVEPYALAALANTTVAAARLLLEELYAASLINQPSHRRYTLHDLVAAYAATLVADLPELDRHTALDRLYDHYAATSSLAMSLTHPSETIRRPRPPITDTATPTLSTQREAQAWLAAETDNLLATAHHAATQQRTDHTLHQSTALRRHLLTRGHYSQATLLHQQALDSARQTSDHIAEQDALCHLGTVHRLQGRYADAADCFEQALVGVGRTGNHDAEQSALCGLGTVRQLQDQHGPAADCFERALAIGRRTGNHHGERVALNGLGDFYLGQGRNGAAADCFERALASARQTESRIGEQDALCRLGTLHSVRGRYERAADCFAQALASACQSGDRSGEQDALLGLGTVHYSQDRYADAADCFERTLAIARQTGYRLSEQEAQLGLGTAYYLQGRYRPAADCFEQALAIACEIGYRGGQFEAHHGLGRVHRATSNHQDALHHERTALHLAVEIDLPGNRARAHDGIAHAHLALGDTSQARHHWQAALDLLTANGTEEPGLTTIAIRTRLLRIDTR